MGSSAAHGTRTAPYTPQAVGRRGRPAAPAADPAGFGPAPGPPPGAGTKKDPAGSCHVESGRREKPKTCVYYQGGF